MRASAGFFAGLAVGGSIAAIRHDAWTGTHGWALFAAGCAVIYLFLTRTRKVK